MTQRKPKEMCRCGHTREQHNRLEDGSKYAISCDHCTEHLAGCAYFWQAVESTSDGECVVCPYCGERAGDAWEWCSNELEQESECGECGKFYVHWAEYTTDYCAGPKLRSDGSDANQGKSTETPQGGS